MEQQLRSIEHELQSLSGEELNARLETYNRLQSQFESQNGYACESEIIGVLKGLGFTEEEFSKKTDTLSGGQKTRVALGKLLLTDPDILLLDEPTNHLDVVTIHWLAEHLKNRWPAGSGALLLVTHDRWFLDEVCESMWEVHDGEIEPFEGGYSAYMLQRVERDRQADVRETKRRNLARKELAWLTRGARARSTKQKFHVKAARELIADVPPVRNTLELKQMATSRLGKQVVDLIDVPQIFEHVQGEADIDPDVADMEASASRVDVVPAMYAEPQVHGSVEVAVDDLTDPRLVDAGVAAAQVAAAAKESQEIQESQENNTDDPAEEITSAAGSVSQVREVTSVLMQLAKVEGIAVFLVGHVTKEGVVAGPKTLEHMVDTVLYFEGDQTAIYRILRGVKNRFGSTNEIGVFEMRRDGLREVENPSEFMLNGRPENASGSVVACSMEGTRPILLEIQALVCESNFGMPRRTAAGTDYNRVNLLMAVLEKRIGYHLGNYDAYVNIAGGIKINEPAIDLGIVMAIVSSYKNRPFDERTIVFGEVGLSGEVRAVNMPEQRVAEAKKLGFETCIVPEVSLDSVKSIGGIKIIGVKSINEAIGLIE